MGIISTRLCSILILLILTCTFTYSAVFTSMDDVSASDDKAAAEWLKVTYWLDEYCTKYGAEEVYGMDTCYPVFTEDYMYMGSPGYVKYTYQHTYDTNMNQIYEVDRVFYEDASCTLGDDNSVIHDGGSYSYREFCTGVSHGYYYTGESYWYTTEIITGEPTTTSFAQDGTLLSLYDSTNDCESNKGLMWYQFQAYTRGLCLATFAELSSSDESYYNQFTSCGQMKQASMGDECSTTGTVETPAFDACSTSYQMAAGFPTMYGSYKFQCMTGTASAPTMQPTKPPVYAPTRVPTLLPFTNPTTAPVPVTPTQHPSSTKGPPTKSPSGSSSASFHPSSHTSHAPFAVPSYPTNSNHPTSEESRAPTLPKQPTMVPSLQQYVVSVQYIQNLFGITADEYKERNNENNEAMSSALEQSTGYDGECVVDIQDVTDSLSTAATISHHTFRGHTRSTMALTSKDLLLQGRADSSTMATSGTTIRSRQRQQAAHTEPTATSTCYVHYTVRIDTADLSSSYVSVDDLVNSISENLAQAVDSIDSAEPTDFDTYLSHAAKETPGSTLDGKTSSDVTYETYTISTDLDDFTDSSDDGNEGQKFTLAPEAIVLISLALFILTIVGFAFLFLIFTGTSVCTAFSNYIGGADDSTLPVGIDERKQVAMNGSSSNPTRAPSVVVVANPMIDAPLDAHAM